MSKNDPTDNEADSATKHPAPTSHDELACDAAWDAHCERHRRDQKAAVEAERQRCIDIVLSVWPAVTEEAGAWKRCQEAIHRKIRGSEIH